jgi:COMM domain containing 1
MGRPQLWASRGDPARQLRLSPHCVAPQIHDSLFKRSVADGRLSKLSWRIDLKSSSRDQPELNEPTAILELTTEPLGASPAPSVALLELNREEVAKTLRTLKAIKDKLAAQT